MRLIRDIIVLTIGFFIALAITIVTFLPVLEWNKDAPNP